jgi:hypothetical protein
MLFTKIDFFLSSLVTSAYSKYNSHLSLYSAKDSSPPSLKASMFGFGMPFIDDVGGANCGATAGDAPADCAAEVGTVGVLMSNREIADVDGDVMGAVMVVTVVVAALVVSVSITGGKLNTGGLKIDFLGGFSPDIH